MYGKNSVKDAENVQCGSREGVIFNQTKICYGFINWRWLLANNESKTRLIDYLMDSWKEKGSRVTLGEVLLVVNSGEQYYLITKKRVNEIAELKYKRGG